MAMKLCVFQGTFNPIHNAHLQVAEFAHKNLGFDKVLFIPAAKPPHKSFDPKMSEHRLNIVKAAISDFPEFEVSDIEYKLEGKSYTCNTIVELYKRYKIDGKINFLIGTDAFRKIESWYRTDDLKKLVDFVVFIRENNFESDELEYLRSKGYNFKFMPLEFLDISSTEIREKIKKCEPVQGFLPKKAEEYINNYGLYKD